MCLVQPMCESTKWLLDIIAHKIFYSNYFPLNIASIFPKFDVNGVIEEPSLMNVLETLQLATFMCKMLIIIRHHPQVNIFPVHFNT